MADEFHGTVKFYNAQRSFGFITRDDGGGDVYVGQDGSRLQPGDHVSFALIVRADGRHRAVDVKVRRAAADSEPRRVWHANGLPSFEEIKA
jgi:cold shock CspA family protein